MSNSVYHPRNRKTQPRPPAPGPLWARPSDGCARRDADATVPSGLGRERMDLQAGQQPSAMMTVYEQQVDPGRGDGPTLRIGVLKDESGTTKPIALRLLPREVAMMTVPGAARGSFRVEPNVAHRNVVPGQALAQGNGGVFLLTEHMLAVTLDELLAAGPPPIPVLVAVMSDVLDGLHAMHTAKGPLQRPAGGVLGALSPYDIVISADGIGRVTGVGQVTFNPGMGPLPLPPARRRLKGLAELRARAEKPGAFAGEAGHLPDGAALHGGASKARDPGLGSTQEEEHDEPACPYVAADMRAVGMMFWEAVTGEPVQGLHEQTSSSLPARRPRTISGLRTRAPAALMEVVARALVVAKRTRFPEARAFAAALRQAVAPAPAAEVSAYVARVVGGRLEAQRRLLNTVNAREQDASSPLGVWNSAQRTVWTIENGFEKHPSGARSASGSPRRFTQVLRRPTAGPVASTPSPQRGSPLGAKAGVGGPSAAGHGARHRGPASTGGGVYSAASASPVDKPLARRRIWRFSILYAPLLAVVPFVVAQLIPEQTGLPEDARAPRGPAPRRAARVPEVKPAIASEPSPVHAQDTALPSKESADPKNTARAGNGRVRAAAERRARRQRMTRQKVRRRRAAARRKRAVVQQRSRPARAVSDCTPPYWYDGQGIRRIKRKCR